MDQFVVVSTLWLLVMLVAPRSLMCSSLSFDFVTDTLIVRRQTQILSIALPTSGCGEQIPDP
eukprot:11490082-Karenia_brevis.AAC.1